MKTKIFLLLVLTAVLLAGCGEKPVTEEELLPPPLYKVDLSVGDGGLAVAMIDDEEVTRAPEDAKVILSAEADEGYKLLRWEVTGAVTATLTTNPALLVMPGGDVVVEAVFSDERIYNITVLSDGGAAVATIGAEAVTQAKAGADVSLTATGSDEYLFVSWNSEDVELSSPGAATLRVTMPECDIVIEAEFLRRYTVTASAGTGGKVAMTIGGTAAGADVPWIASGEEITLTVTTDEGYEFTRWIATGVTIGNLRANPLTFTMPAGNVSLDAVTAFLYDPAETEVEINGVVWATRNVDAPGSFAGSPLDAGMFYQWNRKVGWSSTEPITSTSGEAWSSVDATGNIWAEENDPSPEGYRIPTVDDLAKLCDGTKVENVWVAATATSPAGRRFTDRTTGKSIFLLAAGYRDQQSNSQHEAGALLYTGVWGYYWSVNQTASYLGTNLNFNSDRIQNDGVTWRSNAFQVRPVKK